MKTVTTTALALLFAAAVAAPTLGDTAAPTNQTSLRQLLENDLAKEGYKNIQIAPESFLVHATDAKGNPVMMAINPDSITLVTAVTADNDASAGATGAPAGPRFLKLQNGDMLSSNIVGVDVYDNSNHDLGAIKDVVFDNSKALKGYIVSVGGFLGIIGTHYVAVDADSVKIKYDNSDRKWHANMNASKDELKNAPEFKYEGEWNASKS